MRGTGRWRPRPEELATLASGGFLLATALVTDDPIQRAGLLVTVLLTIAYALLWYRLLPRRTFGEARPLVAGALAQLVVAYMLIVTGGVRSSWFVFYLLPTLATVFSYRPLVTVAVTLMAILGLVAVAFLDPSVRLEDASRELLVVRIIALGAIATTIYMITGAMRVHRARQAEREDHLRMALATTEREALTDPLTGADNRRSLDRALAALTARATRDGRPYAVLMIDLDGLKVLNDRAGHDAGDRALRLVARAASEVVRAYDLVARFGGDEFVVVLQDTSRDAARLTSERLEERFAELTAHDPTFEGTTVSVGTAMWRPGVAPSEVLAEADAEMYGAKRDRGRGRAALVRA